MRLFNQIIQKKLELSQEFFLNRNYKRGIWDFYSAYNISTAIIGAQDPEFKRKNRLWRRFFLSEFDARNFKKIKTHMKRDMAIITQAINLINAETEKMGGDVGEFYKTGHIGILSFEFPE